MEDWMDTDIDDAMEFTTLADGTASQVMISGVQVDSVAYWIRINLEPDAAEEDTSNMSHFLSLPKPDDDKRKRGWKLKFLKDFYEGFSVPEENFKNPSSWEGLTANVIIGEEERRDGKGLQNTIKSFTN